MTVGLIAAVNSQNIIGIRGHIPWHYPLDISRFSRITKGSTVIMGRKTFESMDSKPLPHRRNIVITSNPGKVGNTVESFKTLEEGLRASKGDVWLIGGSRIYEEALLKRLVEVVDITRIPDEFTWTASTETSFFYPDRYTTHGYVRDFSEVHDDPRLRVVRYYRMGSVNAQVMLRKHHVTHDIRVFGEYCSMCLEFDKPPDYVEPPLINDCSWTPFPATHLIGETFTEDDPYPWRKNLEIPVCCKHFVKLFGRAAGCKVE